MTPDDLEPPPPPDTFPCGCVITYRYEDGIPTGVVSPCRRDCRTYAQIIGEAVDAEKPIEFRRQP